jgi:23S rRNA-/tRNA-specific pseudouridylate synthase
MILCGAIPSFFDDSHFLRSSLLKKKKKYRRIVLLPTKARMDHRATEKERKRDRRRERNTVAESRRTQVMYRFTAGSSSSLPLRHVEPYVFEYTSQAKGRWAGQPLLAILAAEYGSFPEAYWPHALASGRVLVNGARVEPAYALKHGDALSHWVHRHEPPVLGERILILADTPGLLVVSKPATVPMHPCGAFRYNSLPFLLEAQLAAEVSNKTSVPHVEAATAAEETVLQATPQSSKLLIVHRLDRLTSGVVLLAKTPEAARELQADFDGGQAQKVYLARVAGNFGSDLDERWRRETLATEESIGWTFEDLPPSRSRSSSASEAAPDSPWIAVQQPIRCLSHRDGAHECAEADPAVTVFTSTDTREAGAKTARTMFRKLAFHGTTSLVECRPTHGRTHQIRLHLRFLGYPIANDPDYGPPKEGSGIDVANAALAQDDDVSQIEDSVNLGASALQWYAQSRRADESLEAFVVRTCVWCNRNEAGFSVCSGERRGPNDRTKLMRDCIWLHAWRYSCFADNDGALKWEFEAPPPAWATNLNLLPCEQDARTTLWNTAAPFEYKAGLGAVIHGRDGDGLSA